MFRTLLSPSSGELHKPGIRIRPAVNTNASHIKPLGD